MEGAMSALPLQRGRAAAGERVEVACAHCSLPVPAGLIERGGAGEQFCCAACRTAYEVIHACGLDRYYALRQRAGGEGVPAAGTVGGAGGRYERFDDPAFQRLYCRGAQGGLMRATLRVEGAHCAACVWLVEALPRVARGVVESRLDLSRSQAQIVWDPARTTLSRAARALDSLGYRPAPARGVGAEESRRREERRALARLGVAGALAGNVMLLAAALYSGAFADMAPGTETFFRWMSAGLGTLAILWPGSVFFRGAWASLRVRRLHLDLPIAIALGAGGVWGVVSVARGAGEIYFDSLAAVVFLLLIGRYVQQRQQRRAAGAVEMLFTMTPTSVRVVDAAGEARETPIDEVRPGELVEAPAHDSVPVDGVVERGASELDQSLLTGESRPVRVGVGDRVTAGAMNLSAALRVRVEAAGEETRIASLMRAVERSDAARAPIVRMADRLAGRFVGTVLTLSLGTLLAWLWIDPARAVDNAIALLIVTCPCALGLATPLAVSAALGRAARRGLLIKGGEPLEQLTKPGVLLLDKTGVVTESRMRLARWVGDASLKPLVGAAEADSTHPVGRALAAELKGAGAVWSVEHRIGQGVVAASHEGRLVIGSPEFVATCAGKAPEWADDAAAALARDGLTPVLIAAGGSVRAVAGVGAPLRVDAADSVHAMRAMGWRVGMCSGDHPDVVRRVAARLGLEPDLCWGGVTPEGKQRVVESLLGQSVVVMVGDGVNDAAALATASVGVGVHGGAEACLEAADVAVRRPGMAPLVELLEGANRAAGVIRRNLGVSLAYNALTASLAMTGVIGPLLAAALMPLSSISVITLSHRSRTFTATPDDAPRGLH